MKSITGFMFITSLALMLVSSYREDVTSTVIFGVGAIINSQHLREAK